MNDNILHQFNKYLPIFYINLIFYLFLNLSSIYPISIILLFYQFIISLKFYLLLSFIY
jgi:hypothetical protein